MTASTDRPTFRALVADVAARAKARLPEQVNGRIESAVELVLVQDVTVQADGSILVGSSTDPLKTYRLVGTTCECPDFTRGQAPDGWCQHRIAAGIQKRVQELLPPEPVPVDPETMPKPFPANDDEPVPAAPAETVPQPEAPVEGSHGINPRHIVRIQGQAFVKFAGLLALAHQRGLQTLKVTWTHNSEELSLAHAIAVFPHGVFEECADSTPGNVGKKVALHWRRLSLTRAKARALRDALGCDMVALEELGGTDDV
jgi:hypothetical protein